MCADWPGCDSELLSMFTYPESYIKNQRLKRTKRKMQAANKISKINSADTPEPILLISDLLISHSLE